MIQCIPEGICSWNFTLRGNGRRAAITYKWTEQGTLTIDGTSYEVEKERPMMGIWSLKHAGIEVFTGTKESIITRSFRLQSGDETYALHPTGLGRTFVLERDNRKIATIRPEHAFTKRATIDWRPGDEEFLVIVFAFWLTVLMWRRTARSSS
ncbi:MAG: hypothetical protein H6834_06660 [Planctomycetes bacterium]|nr:hypothetical protein [Planctomycetota bacterium]MCB9891801.1 hypothetical protein [Planctomycetota bacterium]